MRSTTFEPTNEMTDVKEYDQKVVLNVGGTRHETWLSTLERIPGSRLSLLSKLQEVDESYDFHADEYFFDRNPLAFHSILHFYRSDELHMDHNVCGNIFREELLYWGIEEIDIEPCCWGVYSKYRDHKDTLAALDDNFICPEEEAWNDNDSKWKKFQKKVWRLLEYPASSRVAKAITIISFIFVAMSILTFVLETHYLFQVVEVNGTYVPAADPTTVDCCCKENGSRKTADEIMNFKPHPALEYVDYTCVVFFSLELLARIIFCPDKLSYIRDPMNVIDVVCLIPHYCSIILRAVNDTSSGYMFLKVVMIMRIVRVLRIFKLMKHYSAFKILVYTIKVSTKELMLMVIFLFTGVLIFASAMYYAETENFSSIPIGFWWALVTMTTVGYGDKYPKKEAGYVIGSACVMCGVLVIAFTVPIVVNNFALYYSHAQSRTKVPTRSKKKVMHRSKMSDVVPDDSIETVKLPMEPDNRGHFKTHDDVIKHNLNIKRKSSIEKENNINKPMKLKPNSPEDNNHARRRRRNVGPPPRRSSSEPRSPTPAFEYGDDQQRSLLNNSNDRSSLEEQTSILMKGLAEADRRQQDERRRQHLKLQQRKRTRKKDNSDITTGII